MRQARRSIGYIYCFAIALFDEFPRPEKSEVRFDLGFKQPLNCHLSMTLPQRNEKSGEVHFPTAQVNLPACYPGIPVAYCPFKCAKLESCEYRYQISSH